MIPKQNNFSTKDVCLYKPYLRGFLMHFKLLENHWRLMLPFDPVANILSSLNDTWAVFSYEKVVQLHIIRR